ncbi:hypothetical protein DQ239_03325 [Blastococcus sp. TF02-09]|uniref:glycosyltransferase family 2 protein n=1 Tax=Blastococcus sp. TF02-09 TaxID=2250576 RepID=UPI000DE9B546|nr:glycosyltransferase family A protein [Blastococcus sp. TF02-9]RBY80131.1 hypothetical protein DQ239_03325 [Blastococcus sp. TF02-9]
MSQTDGARALAVRVIGQAVGLLATVLSVARARIPRRRLRAIHRRLPTGVQRRLARVIRVLRRNTRVKVSVIIAAYNSDQAGLERVIRSLDAQTLPRRDFEVLFIDDGSTDDTADRLRAFARTRPHVVVHTIPNSGWSSRPRNVGITMARGTYVLFMDHDDELYPEALSRAYEQGRIESADVVNMKEARTRGWSWGWHEFVPDPAEGARAGVPLLPMTPHKLYRTAFVRQHGIRFLEGNRILWEDIYFNVACLAQGARVAVVTDYPCYHWVATDSNNSATFGRDPDEFWAHLTRLLETIDTSLTEETHRQALLTHHVQARVLAFTGPSSLRRSDEYYERSMGYVRTLVDRYAPPQLDERLLPVHRARAELVRLGDEKLQRRLAEYDRGVTATPEVTELRWEDGLLVISASATLTDADGEPLRFRRSGSGWCRDLPEDLRSALSAEAQDLTDALARATFSLSVKGRDSRSTWRVPSEGSVRMEPDGDGGGRLVGTVTGRFDIGRTAERNWDTERVWDFAARFEALGYVAHRAVRGGHNAVALTRGRSAIAYKNRDGVLSLDVANAVRTVCGSAKPRVDDVDVRAAERHGVVRLELSAVLRDVHNDGGGRLTGEVVLGSGHRLPAEIVAEEGRTVLRSSGSVPPGEYRLKTRFNGRTGETGLTLAVTGDRAEARES